jgi:hypothetical protein
MMSFEDFERFLRERGTAPEALRELLEQAQLERGTAGLDDDFSIVRVAF